MSEAFVPVPEGTRLVHVGPHKTGTTAVQNALWDARQSLRVELRLTVALTKDLPNCPRRDR